MDPNNNNVSVPFSTEMVPGTGMSIPGTGGELPQQIFPELSLPQPTVVTTAAAPVSTGLNFVPGGGFNFAAAGASTSGFVPNLGFGNFTGAPVTGGVAMPRVMPVEKPDKFDGPAMELITQLLLQAFSLGSPLVSDLSREIVNLKIEGKLSEFGRKYFGNQSCEAAKFSFIDDSVLNVYNFGGLFIIIGVVSVAAILGEFLSSSSQLHVWFSSLRATPAVCMNQVVDHLYAWSQWRKPRTDNSVVALASSSST